MATLKKLISLTVFLLTFVELNYAQIIYMQQRHVSSEEREVFERNEMTYWSKVAEQAIQDGKMSGWYFMRVLDYSAVQNDPTQPTHIFINVFDSIDELTNNDAWMNVSEVLGFDPGLLQSHSTLLNVQYYRFEDFIPGPSFKYTILNWAKPVNSSAFLEENSSLWKPFFEKNMEKNGMVGWGIASKIYPQGMDHSSFMTWDHFDSLSDAMKWAAGEVLMDGGESVMEQTKMAEIMPDGFRYRVIFELLDYRY